MSHQTTIATAMTDLELALAAAQSRRFFGRVGREGEWQITRVDDKHAILHGSYGGAVHFNMKDGVLEITGDNDYLNSHFGKEFAELCEEYTYLVGVQDAMQNGAVAIWRVDSPESHAQCMAEAGCEFEWHGGVCCVSQKES